jgi:2-methylisocitrate lyase-like PEP mutase family enzyme
METAMANPLNERLRARLAERNAMLVPGAPNALTARIIEDAGFEAAYVTGAGIANAFLGSPDIGLVTASELAEHVAAIRDAVEIPLIIDADTGFGNAINVRRTVRLLERCGANAIQLEDQDFPKRCGHLDGKALISAEEMCGKIRAALDARHSRETLVIARTDAVAAEGFERAIERAARYREAGADMLFVEAPRTKDDLARIIAALGRNVPLMANMVEGGKTPPLSGAELEAIGFALVIFPGGIVRALARTAQDYYASLAAHGTTEPFRARMLDFEAINALVGTPDMIALGKRYETSPAPAPADRKSGGRR